MNEREQDAGLPPTPGYRYAEEVDGRLYVAGQVPHDAAGALAGRGDPYQQAEQCLRNLQTLLSVHEFDLADVRRLTIYVVGTREDLVAAWRAATRYFSDDVPPATLLGVAVLGHPEQLVEIDAEIARAR